MSQKLSLGCFKWIEETSHLNDDSDIGYFIEAMFNILKILFSLKIPLNLKERKLQKLNSF